MPISDKISDNKMTDQDKGRSQKKMSQKYGLFHTVGGWGPAKSIPLIRKSTSLKLKK